MSEGRYKLRSLCAGIVGGGNTNADQGIAEQLAMQRRGMGGASRSRGRAPARLHAWFQRGYFQPPHADRAGQQRSLLSDPIRHALVGSHGFLSWKSGSTTAKSGAAPATSSA